jgi:hypothetical protein
MLIFIFTYSLPALNNVYSGSLLIPLIGKQNIEFERLKPNTSQVRLRGLINCDGFIYNDGNDEKCISKSAMSYKLDNYLKNIMTKYRCTIEAPYYDVLSDTILFVLKINLVGLTKSIKLLNTNTNSNSNTKTNSNIKKMKY